MSTHSNEANTIKTLLTVIRGLSIDDCYEKNIIALHAFRAFKDHYSNPNDQVAKLESIENNKGEHLHYASDYTTLRFRFDSDAVSDDDHNSDVYIKITCSIDWLENKLHCRASLNSEENEDGCSMPVSLALQHQVNDACKQLITEQCRILSDAGISLSSVNDIPNWNYSFLLEEPPITEESTSMSL